MSSNVAVQDSQFGVPFEANLYGFIFGFVRGICCFNTFRMHIKVRNVTNKTHNFRCSGLHCMMPIDSVQIST